MTKKYKHFERKGWSVIQKYTKNGWFKRLITRKDFSWKDFALCSDFKYGEEFFDEYYKDIIQREYIEEEEENATPSGNGAKNQNHLK